LFLSPEGVYRIGADGTGEERLLQSPERKFVTDWSRNGRFVLCTEEEKDTGRDIWVLPVTPDGRALPGAKPWPFVRDPFDQHQAHFSPDTRWVAYQSTESGQSEIYVRSFPEAREKLRISTSGGDLLQWGEGGRELFYRSRDNKLMAVTLKPSGTSLEVSLPRELFALPGELQGPNSYEAARDGQRFLINDLSASPEPLTVIVNWPALLKKVVPAP
jgi:Tol biopolymer transport system component